MVAALLWVFLGQAPVESVQERYEIEKIQLCSPVPLSMGGAHALAGVDQLEGALPCRGQPRAIVPWEELFVERPELLEATRSSPWRWILTGTFGAAFTLDAQALVAAPVLAVWTPGGQVEVVGTEFSVTWEPARRALGVAVREGQVRVVPNEAAMVPLGTGERFFQAGLTLGERLIRLELGKLYVHHLRNAAAAERVLLPLTSEPSSTGETARELLETLREGG